MVTSTREYPRAPRESALCPEVCHDTLTWLSGNRKNPRVPGSSRMTAPREKSLGGSNKSLPLRQAAEYLGVPVRTFEKNWRAWGLIASFYGRRYHFRIRDLDHFIESNRV